MALGWKDIDDRVQVDRGFIGYFYIRWHRNTVLQTKNQATHRR